MCKATELDVFLESFDTPDVKQAYRMALETLRDRYSETGILAGKRHFSDLWTRDFCFASWGALEIEDYTVVKRGLETLLQHVAEDGQVPLRVGQPVFFLKYIGIDANPPKPRYKEDKGISVSIDNNALFLITVHRYVLLTSDMSFLHQHIDTLKQVLVWNYLQDMDDDLLIEEGHYAGWADSLKREGKVLYTNVLHYQATRLYADLVRRLERHEEAHYYERQAEKVKLALNQSFWNGQFYVDWISVNTRQETFASDGNLLAILYGVASPDRVKRIQRCLNEFQLDLGYTTGTNYPKYRPRHVYFPFFLLNMQDYHNGLDWLWIGCLDIVCKFQQGHYTQARDQLAAMSHKIVAHNGVYEVYDKGLPVKRLFYKSEEFFAWSSGMFVWMVASLSVSQSEGNR